MVDAFNPPDLWQPLGPFSQIASQGDGRILHLKGQFALDRDGRIVGAGDMRAQLCQMLENIRTALTSIGGEPGDIRREFLSTPFPIITTIEVVRLYDRALLVEISAIGEVPLSRFKRLSDERYLPL